MEKKKPNLLPLVLRLFLAFSTFLSEVPYFIPKEVPRQNERSHATLLCLMAINMTYHHRGAMGFCGNYNLRPLRARIH